MLLMHWRRRGTPVPSYLLHQTFDLIYLRFFLHEMSGLTKKEKVSHCDLAALSSRWCPGRLPRSAMPRAGPVHVPQLSEPRTHSYASTCIQIDLLMS